MERCQEVMTDLFIVGVYARTDGTFQLILIFVKYTLVHQP